MEPLVARPETSDFVLLAAHQARTPVSFYTGAPVLHFHADRCKLVVLESDLRAAPALRALFAPAANDPRDGRPDERVLDGVGVWVTSDKFLLYAAAAAAGVAVAYRAISLHAIQSLGQAPDSQALYMQIAVPHDNNDDDDDDDDDDDKTIALTIIPGVEDGADDDRADEIDETGEDEQPPTQRLYAALSACSNLHPDPVDDSADDLPPPVDGSSGWITADNMHEYFDADGNWLGDNADAEADDGPVSLGPGAGTVRRRDADTANGDDSVADPDQLDESKWRRTD